MAIVKPSKSGNGVVFTDDFGNVYVTSKKYLLSVLSGRMKAPFVLMTRMPVPAQVDRFKPSPILGKDNSRIEEGDDGWRDPQCSHNIQSGTDAEDGMDRKQSNKREKKESYSDKVVW